MEEDLWNNGDRVMAVKRTTQDTLASISFRRTGPFMVAPREHIQWANIEPFLAIELDDIPT